MTTEQDKLSWENDNLPKSLKSIKAKITETNILLTKHEKIKKAYIEDFLLETYNILCKTKYLSNYNWTRKQLYSNDDKTCISLLAFNEPLTDNIIEILETTDPENTIYLKSEPRNITIELRPYTDNSTGIIINGTDQQIEQTLKNLGINPELLD